MLYEKFEEIPFQNRTKGRLRQIYAVIYYMKKGYSHTEAIGKALDYFPQVNDYQTIADKCGRQFAGDIPSFVKWYETGELLSKLVQKNNLSEEDKKIFAELLDTSSEKMKDTLKSENEIDRGILEEKKEVLHLWKGVLKNQSSGVEFSTIERHHQHQKMQKDARLFVKNPSSDIFTEFWDKMDTAQRVARAKNVWEENSPDILAEVISDMIESSDFKPEWVERVGSARRTLWELFGIFHIENKPLLNSCSEKGLKFFGFEVRDKYENVLSNFEKFRDEIYLKEIGHITKELNYEVPINFEIDQLFNVVDKTNKKSLDKAETEEEKTLYKAVLRLKRKTDDNLESEEDIKNKPINYWQISPGEEWRNLWTKCSKNNIIVIGWDIGNISEMDEEAIKDAIGVDKITNNVKSNFYIGHKIEQGDVVIAKKGNTKEVYGIGVVSKAYYKDKEKAKNLLGEKHRNYNDFIDVDWIIDFEEVIGEKLTVTELNNQFAKATVLPYKYFDELKEIIIKKDEKYRELFKQLEDKGNRLKKELADLHKEHIEEAERKEKRRWGEVKRDLEYDLDIGFEIDSEKLFFPINIQKNIENQITSSLKIGKHIILIGPPGTGKSKLAKQICKHYSEKYIMSTATSDWSTFDTIGGYRPDEDGSLQFKPGMFLKCFKDSVKFEPDNKWLIIDEINRADIDKAFGSLFSALTGDDITLPFETDDGSIKVIGDPEEETEIKINTYIIHPDWGIIATMNTFDKTSLYEMSYAFMRRFAFIPVDIPLETEIDKELIKEYLKIWGGEPEKDEEIVEKMPGIWKTINKTRKIGPAIIEDIYKYVKNKSGDYASAIIMFVLPQFEGLLEEEIIDFFNDLDIEDKTRVKQFCSEFFDIDLEKFEKKSEG